MFGLTKLGGWGELVPIAKEPAAEFNLWRPFSDPDFPWLGSIIASPIVDIWYWCTDQNIVPRTLAARNLTQARRGAIVQRGPRAGYCRVKGLSVRNGMAGNPAPLAKFGSDASFQAKRTAVG